LARQLSNRRQQLGNKQIVELTIVLIPSRDRQEALPLYRHRAISRRFLPGAAQLLLCAKLKFDARTLLKLDARAHLPRAVSTEIRRPR
jgi:hypothetical protein